MSISTQGAGNTTASTATTQAIKDNGMLDRNAFMQLLVAQLQHQDPIEPMKDQEFAAQLAQFNSLDAIMNLSEQFGAFVNLQQWSSQLGQATGLIGKTVDLAVDNSTVTGTVSAVRIIDGQVNLVVDGQTYSVGQLQEVRA